MRLNAGTHTGAVTVSVINDTTELASASLNTSGVGSASYSTITISPSGGAARTISGSLASPLVFLNGADNVTINGLNTGGNSLTISNTSTAATAGTTTIKFVGDASNNIVPPIAQSWARPWSRPDRMAAISRSSRALRRATTTTPSPIAISDPRAPTADQVDLWFGISHRHCD